MMNLLRRIASLPGLRAVVLQPRVRKTIAGVLALRFLRAAWLTTTPWRFVANELLLARGQTRRYTLDDGSPVLLLHRRDLEGFHELFRGGEYEPPPALAARLDDVKIVLDVGANVGMFAHWAARRWPAATVVALEPVPENADAFRAWQQQSRIDARLLEACAMTHEGRLVLTGGTGSGSVFSEDPADASGIEVDGVDVFPLMADADLVKIDIEGSEWPILLDPRMATLGRTTLVMEYHRVGAPSLPASDAARRLLEGAGFTVGHDKPNHWGHGVLWAWKD
jgi:FkbM family methyltransferase